jgi:RND family efflux transporter MFP subunit
LSVRALEFFFAAVAVRLSGTPNFDFGFLMSRMNVFVHVLFGVFRPGLLAVVAAVAAGCGGAPEGAAPGGEGPGGGPPGAMAVPVEMVTLERRPVERATEFVATVKSRRSTTIQPQVEGFLTRITVTSGERVTPGTTLFEIDSATQEAAVAGLQSQRAAREADATYARQQADRAKMLLDAGAASQQEYEQAVALAKTAEAQLAVIDDQIRQQRAELAYYQVVAPTAGSVGDVPVRVGDRVTRSTVLTTIEDNVGLELYLQVPVQQADELRVGLPVEILGNGGVPVATQRLSFVSSAVDDTTQTVLAKAPLARQGSGFRADQFVRVRLIWSEDPTLTVPVVSVLRISGQQFVYVAEPSEGGGLVARLHAVTLGSMTGSDYIVLDGVSEGDRLIVSGIQKIVDGAPVQPLPSDGGRGGA